MVEDDPLPDSDNTDVDETQSAEIDPYIGQFVWIETIGKVLDVIISDN